MLKKFLIERNVPDIGSTKRDEFKKLTEKSNGIIDKMGADDIKWSESFVTKDKVYCVYEAANEDLIRKHAEQCGMPADTITEIKETLSPDFGQDDDFYKGKQPDSGVNLSYS